MNAVSIGFRDPSVRGRLEAWAAAHGQSMSAFAEELLDEGLRGRDHPLIVFRDRPAGRRAALVSGPNVWEVVTAVVGGDIQREQRVARAGELLNVPTSHVDAAPRYYAEFTHETDARITANQQAAEREMRLWERRQALTAQ